jgi:hypothetical protein
MYKVREFRFKTVDSFDVQSELDKIAADEKTAGQVVSRGVLGSVIVHLQDGEVHYVPSGKGIDCIIFRG